jgi:acyl-coenzyme A synthetase/AMP-(fatty) acid ligase
MANVADIITRHAAERPYAVAIAGEGGVLHYHRLERAIWRVAAVLRRAGVAEGDVVGISLPHSALYLVATYALARIGAAHAPLPLEDPARMRLSYAQRFGVRHVVAGAGAAAIPGVPLIRLTRAAMEATRAEVSPGLRVEGDDRLLAIWRTSGTTNEAKGVAITHRQWLEVEQSRAQYYPRPEEDRYLAVVEMSLVYGLNSCERALYNGGTLFLPPKPLGSRMLLELIDRHAINRLAVTPNMLDALLPSLPEDQCRCPSIRDLTVAGMAMPETLRREIRRRFSPGLVIRYGSNEARYVTHADARMLEAHPDTVGAAMNGVELEVVDDNDRPVARGEPGRVRARAPWMATGYYNAPELDAGTFRGGWVYLGDMGVLSAEGMLFLRGRVDDMMNYDGLKVMPAEIEEVLLQHPAVAEAVAFPVPSPRHQDLPVAAVTVRQEVSAEALRKFCRERLGRRAPFLVSIEKTLPRNAMGKVVRRELAKRIAAELAERK